MAAWVAPLITGALSYMSAQDHADSISSAADRAAKAGAFKPYNIKSGFGSSSFSPEVAGTQGYWQPGTQSNYWGDRRGPGETTPGQWIPGTPGSPATATGALSPEYQAFRDQYLRMAGDMGGAITGYDPQSAASSLYGKLAALSADDEEQLRLQTENRLLAQGMLGSSGGALQRNAVEDSIAKNRLAREVTAYTQAQSDLDRMLARQGNAINAATSLDQLPLQLLNLGGSFGGQGMAGNQFGANLQFNAASDAADSTAAFWKSLSGGIANYFSDADTYRMPTSQYTQPGLNANERYGMFGSSLYPERR